MAFLHNGSDQSSRTSLKTLKTELRMENLAKRRAIPKDVKAKLDKEICKRIISTVSFSLIYRICELFPPLWPEIGQYPLAAALLGAIFVGMGCGLCVRVGGAPSGDDALAMSLSHITKIPIQWIYLVSDLTVLLLSLSYIPFRRIGYSLLTVVLSGQIIGWMHKKE